MPSLTRKRNELSRPEAIRQKSPKDLNAHTLRQTGLRGFPSWFLRRLSFLLFFFALVASPVLAEHTRTWRQASYDDFLKGTPHGVAVRSDGRLELAPKFTLLADADASYLWSLRVDPKGALSPAGGSPAKVFRFDSKGKPSVVFESSDL